MNKGFSSILNASRWIAAFLVLITHERHILFVDLKDVFAQTFLIKGFYFWTSLGQEAVIVFFVISGLLVGALTLEKWKNGAPADITDYFIHRFSRIYIVFIPAILLGLVLDNIGIKYFDGVQLYSSSDKYPIDCMGGAIVKDNVGLHAVLGNMAMLQTITVNELGSNCPLWSLANEWWYYCIWGLLLVSFFYKGWRRWFSVMFIVGLLIFLPFRMMLWMSIWLLGVGVYYYSRSNLPKPHPIMGFSVFLVVLTIYRMSHNQDYLNHPDSLLTSFSRDFLLGLAFSIALIGFWKLEKPIWLDSTHTKFASFSYSLYLVHFPLMVLLVAVSNQCFNINFLQQPSFSVLLYFVVMSLTLFLFAYLFSLFTEKHTFKLVTQLRKVFLSGKYPV